uniref:Uncharacterized protein n=1 Tax=Oryzias sinensis TaxID=183150 RepID=A0A8C7X4A3_9TELE
MHAPSLDPPPPDLMAGGSQQMGLESASTHSEHDSFIKSSQNTKESMGFLGQGLKQLFQLQRKRLSFSRGTSPSAPRVNFESSCCDSDHPSAPVVHSTAGRGSAAAGMIRRGTSLQSRRSKGSGSASGDRDPLLRGSPQAPQRRYTHDPQQHTSRRRSSSTTETTPCSPLERTCITGETFYKKRLHTALHSTDPNIK